MSVFFNGRLITTPTTASVVDDSAMRNQNLTVGNVLALVGQSAGGEPLTALRFGSPSEADAVLISGELLDAVHKAFAPSDETGGPTTVIAVRVNPATQATGVIKDSGSNTVISLTSTNYGQLQNQIKYKVEAGTVQGFRLTTQMGSSYYTQDNIAKGAFSIVYTGGQVSATITINGTQCILAAPAGTTVATLNFTDYTKISDLVDRINLVSGFDATVLDGNYTGATANGLDFVTAQSVMTSFNVRADLQACVDWLNGNGEGFVDAVRATNTGTLPAVAPFQFLSGGSDGVTTNTQWSDAFTALQSIDAQWVVPISSDPSIAAMCDAHVQYMSTVAMRERRAICGTAIGTSDTAAIAAAKALNSDRTSLVHIGYYDYDDTGKLTLYAPYMTAALIGGMFSGVNPGTPLTNKAIAVRGLERDLRNPTDTDPLIQGGVLCVENTAQGYKVVKSISTWLVNSNYNRVEQSTGVAVDFVARNVRDALDVLRGQKGNPLVLQRAVSITDTVLRQLSIQEPQGPGVLVGDKTNPPYLGIQASLNGDVLNVQFQCSPVIPVNYVLASIFAVPFSGTATA